MSGSDPRSVTPTTAPNRALWPRVRRTVIICASTLVLIVVVWLAFPEKEKPAEPYSHQARVGYTDYDAPKPVVVPVAVQKPMALPMATATTLPDSQPVTAAVQQDTRKVYSYKVAELPEYLKPKDKSVSAAVKETSHIDFKTSTFPGTKAGVIANRSLTLMPGIVRCAGSTAVETDLAGPFMCVLPADVKSPTGVVLMERGTQVLGTYETMEQGQGRVKAVTALATTPNGVVVQLGGPMAGALGQTGLEGEVDTHFWQRFGPAMVLTAIEALPSIAQAALSRNGNNSNNNYFSFGGIGGGGAAGSLAQEALRNSINIKPTTTIHQGADVALWIMDYKDFNDVYRLETRR